MADQDNEGKRYYLIQEILKQSEPSNLNNSS